MASFKNIFTSLTDAASSAVEKLKTGSADPPLPSDDSKIPPQEIPDDDDATFSTPSHAQQQNVDLTHPDSTYSFEPPPPRATVLEPAAAYLEAWTTQSPPAPTESIASHDVPDIPDSPEQDVEPEEEAINYVHSFMTVPETSQSPPDTKSIDSSVALENTVDEKESSMAPEEVRSVLGFYVQGCVVILKNTRTDPEFEEEDRPETLPSEADFGIHESPESEASETPNVEAVSRSDH